MSENGRPWWDGRRPAGFRFSAADAVVVALCAGAAWLAWSAAGAAARPDYHGLGCSLLGKPRKT